MLVFLHICSHQIHTQQLCKRSSSLSDRKEALLDAFNTGCFLETVCACSQEGKERRDALSLDLATLHNDGWIDVVVAFEDLKNEPSTAPDFFSTRIVFEKVLPYLNAPISAVMQCVLRLYRSAGQDMAAGTIIASFVDFCAKDTSRPSDALREIESDPDTFCDLLIGTIVAGSRINNPQYLAEAIRLSEHENIALRRQAVFSIGEFSRLEGVRIPDDVFVALTRSAAEESDGQILGGCIRSAFTLLQKDSTQEQQVVEIITAALSKGDEYTLYMASKIFGFDTKKIPNSLLNVLLSRLKYANLINRGILENIDYGVSCLLKRDSPDQGILFFEDLLLNQPDTLTLKIFDSVTAEIYHNKALFNKVLTRWLLRGESVLCEVLGAIVSSHHGKNIQLDIDPEELKSPDIAQIIFIARKAIGYFFINPITVASILISLMRLTMDEEILKELAELLFNPVLLNFTRSACEYVKKQLEQESEKVKQTIENALQKIEEYLEDIRSVSILPALHPSNAQREEHHRYTSRMMVESMKDAESQFVFLNLFPKVTLLYGKKAISYIYDGGEQPRRMETPLNSFRSETEVPRMGNIDPYGLDYMLRVFKAEKLYQ